MTPTFDTPEEREAYVETLTVALFKVNGDGLDYALDNSYLTAQDFQDTDAELSEAIEAARGPLAALTELLDQRAAEFDVEDY